MDYPAFYSDMNHIIYVQEIVRAGIDIKASFDYNAFPEVTASYYISDASTEFCFKILHGWPKNEVSIYAYYQHRTITWCKGFWNIPYVSCQVIKSLYTNVSRVRDMCFSRAASTGVARINGMLHPTPGIFLRTVLILFGAAAISFDVPP